MNEEPTSDIYGKEEEQYRAGFKITELFVKYAGGVKTPHDQAGIVINSRNTVKLLYRPFDIRNTRNFPHTGINKHFIHHTNVGLITCRQKSTSDFQHIFITKKTADSCVFSSQAKETTYLFPLYLYPQELEQSNPAVEDTEAETRYPQRIPNFNRNIVQKIAAGLNLLFIPEPETGNVCYATNNADMRDDFKTVFTPLDVLDYIYAILHSPTYRERYKVFLKTGFPRIPYPKEETFWPLVQLGGTLRQVHLLECPAVEHFITSFPVEGNNRVTRKITEKDPGFISVEEGYGKVWINDRQYFDTVPESAWNFYIGGYRPAQKWLTDRRGEQLSVQDIRHYQKIIAALMETDRLMKEMDNIAG